MTAIRQLSRATAVHQILLSLDCMPSAAQDISRDRLIAECLRQTLCSLATPPGSSCAFEPVYVVRLLHHARRQLSPIWPELGRAIPSPTQAMPEAGDDDPVGRVLDALHDLRDIASLGHGYWLPVATRFVDLPSGKVLVVGGDGIADVKRTYGVMVAFTGICRMVSRKALPAAVTRDPTLWQSLPTWQGLWEGGSLRVWTAQAVEHAHAHLKDSGSDITDFEVYAPDRRPRDPQYFRWARTTDMTTAPVDLVLCRSPLGRYQPRTYWFGTLKAHKGTVYLARESPVDPSRVRRLLYGLDLTSSMPTHVVASSAANDGGDRRVTLRSWLPPEERRLFLALAHETSPIPGRLPLTFSFAEEVAPTLLSALSNLGIELVTSRQSKERT